MLVPWEIFTDIIRWKIGREELKKNEPNHSDKYS